MKVGFLLMLAAGIACAQNNDIGLLFGYSGPSARVVLGTQVQVYAHDTGVTGQINYAMQLKEDKVGRLYLELPLLVGGSVSANAGIFNSGSVKGGIYFTPGVRYNLTLHPRVSVYGAIGGGVASFSQTGSWQSGMFRTAGTEWTTSPALAFGGGLDFRLTRLFSLRGEIRDFVSRRGLGLAEGRNHSVVSFGVGFHW